MSHWFHLLAALIAFLAIAIKGQELFESEFRPLRLGTPKGCEPVARCLDRTLNGYKRGYNIEQFLHEAQESMRGRVPRRCTQARLDRFANDAKRLHRLRDSSPCSSDYTPPSAPRPLPQQQRGNWYLNPGAQENTNILDLPFRNRNSRRRQKRFNIWNPGAKGAPAANSPFNDDYNPLKDYESEAAFREVSHCLKKEHRCSCPEINSCEQCYQLEKIEPIHERIHEVEMDMARIKYDCGINI